MPYMNVMEVESAIVALASTYPSFCELITLPNLTIEGRTTHAVRLGTQPANSVDTYYLTGGVHAREWGSCEVLVNLATDLCDAYAGGTGVGYGGKYYSPGEIKTIMEQMNVIIFPCVNPDGRNYSQGGATQALWRKNRDTADSGGNPDNYGIDINRNQDFLWDFATAFAPAARIDSLGSADQSADTYHGHAPQSEPETKNITYIHDTYTRIRWYVDVHSFSEDILYVWGDDESQVTDPTQNFTNPAYNGERGLVGDSYAEYIPDGDQATVIDLANAFTRTLAEVRGTAYVAKPGFSLYATSGANDDYAYSRHIVDPSKSKALSFTVEWGTEFQPAWAEMENIIKDVSCGLIGLGLEALGINSFIVTDRDTFSSYEVDTTLSYPQAFYVIYDGIAPSALNVPGAAPAIQFLDAINGNPITSMYVTLNGVDLENSGALDTPQRISFTFEVDFKDESAFTAETREIYVQASFGGMQDVALMQLIKQPNPYMVDGAISWLSTDVRVFQLRPNHQVNNHSSVTLADPDTDANAPYEYIQALVKELRATGNATTPIFETMNPDEQSSQLELSRTVNGVRVLNFAVAKVRYRAQSQDAAGVRVFFRTFNTMVSDLSYTTNPNADVQNYRRNAAGTAPLLGLNTFFSGAGNQIVSIPYFAEKRFDTSTLSMNGQTDDTNKRDLDHAGGTEALEYFGCWLDFNQKEDQFPVQVPLGSDGPFTNRIPIPQFIRGIHTCLVAEIRYQPGATDPIPNGTTPASSDRLAQRNLAVVESDNPGNAATHTVQHTLLVKPSKVAAFAEDRRGSRAFHDELVIRWNDIPKGSTATLYFPDWNADDILALAAQRPGPTMLSKVDAHTVACTVRDISYIQMPGQLTQPIPGLVTVQLPLSVREGQQFNIDVQQHTGSTYLRVLSARQAETRLPQRQDVSVSARKVLGAFRMAVAVKAGEPLLQKAVRNLAVLRYIFQAIPTSDSWHPVFVRYIGQLGDQIKGLGIDPTLIKPSLDDPGLPGFPVLPPADKHVWHTGKVCEVIFDCFGDFEGFVLESCEERHHFKSTEKGIGHLVMTACRERLLLSVRTRREKNREHIVEIIVRSG
jgi:murein tripeptide amidase MpaA